jgi:pimeloyl-ACP methyl ester carboxylesterase
LVVFAHGSGSSRHSPRNIYVASVLQNAGFATLLMDLFIEEEEEWDSIRAHLRFDIELLSERLCGVTDWVLKQPRLKDLPIGYFGASTGAAAALASAVHYPKEVHAIVSRGGRPDLAEESLGKLRTPTLLIVGGSDRGVLHLNERALEPLRGPKKLVIVPGATHLFEEPGALEAVAQHATEWFQHYLVESQHLVR